MPWTRLPSRMRSGMPTLPSAKQGSQMFAPPKAKVVRPPSAAASGEPNGSVAGVPSAGMPT